MKLRLVKQFTEIICIVLLFFSLSACLGINNKKQPDNLTKTLGVEITIDQEVANSNNNKIRQTPEVRLVFTKPIHKDSIDNMAEKVYLLAKDSTPTGKIRLVLDKTKGDDSTHYFRLNDGKLNNKSSYTVVVDKDIKAVDGVSLSAEKTQEFTVGNWVGPKLETIEPTKDVNGKVKDQPEITLTFDYAMNVNSVIAANNVELQLDEGNDPLASTSDPIKIIGAAIAGNDKQFKFTLADVNKKLDSNKTYKIVVGPNVKDIDNNPINEGDNSKKFTIGDFILPKLDKYTPVHNSKDVNRSTIIELEFSKKMDVVVLKVFLILSELSEGGKDVETDINISETSDHKTNVKIMPKYPLKAKTKYAFVGGTPMDINGNLLDKPIYFEFETGEANNITVMMLTPSSDKRIPITQKEIQLKFSEAMDLDSMKSNNIVLYYDDNIDNQVPIDINLLDKDANIYSVKPIDDTTTFIADKKYSILIKKEVKSQQYKDSLGRDQMFTFNTGNEIKPTVAYTKNNNWRIYEDKDVFMYETGEIVKLKFSKKMDFSATDLASHFSLGCYVSKSDTHGKDTNCDFDTKIDKATPDNDSQTITLTLGKIQKSILHRSWYDERTIYGLKINGIKDEEGNIVSDDKSLNSLNFIACFDEEWTGGSRPVCRQNNMMKSWLRLHHSTKSK